MTKRLEKDGIDQVLFPEVKNFRIKDFYSNKVITTDSFWLKMVLEVECDSTYSEKFKILVTPCKIEIPHDLLVTNIIGVATYDKLKLLAIIKGLLDVQMNGEKGSLDIQRDGTNLIIFKEEEDDVEDYIYLWWDDDETKWFLDYVSNKEQDQE